MKKIRNIISILDWCHVIMLIIVVIGTFHIMLYYDWDMPFIYELTKKSLIISACIFALVNIAIHGRIYHGIPRVFIQMYFMHRKVNIMVIYPTIMLVQLMVYVSIFPEHATTLIPAFISNVFVFNMYMHIIFPLLYFMRCTKYSGFTILLCDEEGLEDEAD